MQTVLILTTGERRPLEHFVAHTLHHAKRGDVGALDTLDHAQCVAVENGAADASRLIVAMLKTPERIGDLLQSAQADTVVMLGAVLARTFTDLQPGSVVGMVPEDDDDRARLAGLHDLPLTAQ